ncbi:DUF6503 family protein [Mongoliitalea daihaiensis]|uniref:DUF6503 family protein n=1 Tax=Mongoliitalea daihaiensis TaxID=2782006 RepID=UPI001F467B4A|nr:DUF6503 family protein [Mongoliitalea daihaiensis]UJP64792.1 hypothetical protein IPZ59_18685 [Mongoliitalea daihaiensis]
MKKFIVLGLLISFLVGCKENNPAQEIVDKAITAHGGKSFEQSTIEFDFRERSYSIFKSPEAFEYSREFTDSTGLIKDVLNNAGFTRTVNGVEVSLEEKQIAAFTNSVNSVAYFAFLPYGLNDAAAIKTSLGQVTMEGKPYELVKVTFVEEGGGEDFEDEFLYWFDADTFKLAYLAYSFHTNEGGVRFRKAIREHAVNGLILLDYENYKPKIKDTPLEDLAALFEAGELELLSEIEMEDVRVKSKQ